MDEEYTEYKLISGGKGPTMMPHHIMKIPSNKFNIDTLAKPFKMKRQAPQEEIKEEESQPNNAFKRKSKAFFLGREDKDVVLGGSEVKAGSLIAPIGSRFADPDKQPWVLSDAENETFIGNLEGSQSSNYVLFVSTNEGFKVLPVSKWYKFNYKTTHRTLTLEEAEERMSKKRVKDRWIMRDVDGEDSSQKSTKKTGQSTISSLTQKILDGYVKEEDIAVKKEPKRRINEDSGMDYEEVFEDDEVIDFGIEDKEESKDAFNRLHKAEEDLEKGDPWLNPDAKKLAKNLMKREGADLYDMGEDNPYWSDEDEEPVQVKEEPKTNLLLEKLKKSKSQRSQSSATSSRPSSPTIKSEKSVSGLKIKFSMNSDSLPAAKRQKTEDESSGTPPPPSAADVVAREMEKERKMMRRKERASKSPAPSSGATPSPGPSGILDNDPDVMTEAEFLQIISSREPGGIQIGELVKELSVWFAKDKKKNTSKMKELLKLHCNQDRTTKIVTLKQK